MDLLVLLVEANGELVTRQEIMDSVWNNRFVTDYALNNLISTLRKHLNKDDPTLTSEQDLSASTS